MTQREGFVAILERHRLILCLAGAVGALAGGVAGLLRAPSYQANAKLVIVPVDDPTATGGVTAGYDLATVTLPVVMAILHSSSLGERTVERLDLARAWHLTQAQAQARVTGGVMVGSERKTNLVTLSYIDHSPETARNVVAALAELATTMSTELWSARNRQHRQTLERDLAEIDGRLAAAENALQEFRERNHVVDLPEQIRATVEEGAALERLRIGKSIDVRIAGGFGAPDSVEVRKGSIERAAAERALKTLRAGTGSAPLLPLDQLPRLEIEHARLKRAVDEQAARRDLLSLKVSQLVAAEARPGGVAQVIDPPLLPTGRLLGGIVRLALAGAALAALLAALFVWRRATLPHGSLTQGIEIRSGHAG
jgi:uncharacterized protein involved in exopolysaccharide biosynthesis